MSDPITDLITDIQHNGLRWLSILTLYSIYRKERRNYYLDRRDDALFQNLKTLLEDRGKGECFVGNPNSKVNLERELLERGRIMLSPARIMELFTRRKVTDKLILSRRKKTMMQFLRSNISKKLLALIIGVAVTALNAKFNLQLSENDIYILFAGVIAYVLGQSHVDGRKALANTVHAVSQVVQTSTGVTADTTYSDLYPTIKIVHEGINKILTDVQKNDASQAFKDAASTYMAIMGIIKSIQQPAPLPEIPSQQESA